MTYNILPDDGAGVVLGPLVVGELTGIFVVMAVTWVVLVLVVSV